MDQDKFLAIHRGPAVKNLVFKLAEFSILAFHMDTSITAPKKAPSELQFCYSYDNEKSKSLTCFFLLVCKSQREKRGKRMDLVLTDGQGFTAQSLIPQWLLSFQKGQGFFRFTYK